MVKQKKNNSIYWIVGAIVLFIAIMIIYNYFNPKSVEELTESDFQILSIEWNTYATHIIGGNPFPENIEYSTQEIDWEEECNSITEDRSAYAGWIDYTLITQQSENLTCNFIINGVDKKSDNIPGWTFKKGVYIWKESPEPVFPNVENKIIICCTSNTKEGEVCDSITLPARC